MDSQIVHYGGTVCQYYIPSASLAGWKIGTKENSDIKIDKFQKMQSQISLTENHLCPSVNFKTFDLNLKCGRFSLTEMQPLSQVNENELQFTGGRPTHPKIKLSRPWQSS